VKRVLITGAAGGIGAAAAEALRARGAQVVGLDLHADGESVMECDVRDQDSVDRGVAEAIDRLGGLDVLINNAGIAGPTAPVEAIDIAEWNRTIAVDLNGMFYCTRRAVPLLKAAGGGSIINLSSVAGRLGYPLRTPYAAAKWGVVGFTKSLAMELGPANIRVNAIQPGIVEGERIERVISAKAKAFGATFDEYKRQLLSKVSLRRTVSPLDIANMALFLATDAGRNISGQALSVCGNVESLV
jgi:NAD(P)-dependent dehydrogenase (short-subunit alcohol dehydrogenase family)